MSTIFERIVAGEVPAQIVYEDRWCVAFRDIDPQAPTHLLVVPRKPLPGVSAAGEDDVELLGHVLWAAAEVARRLDLADYRLVINDGAGAGQSVFHLHCHLLAGRPFRWPPG